MTRGGRTGIGDLIEIETHIQKPIANIHARILSRGMNRLKVANIFWTSLITLLLASSLLVGKAMASPAGRVYVDPPLIKGIYPTDPDPTFTADIKVDADNLTGWEFTLSFVPSLLRVLSVTRGPFLETAGDTMWQNGTVTPVIDNFMGFVTARDMLLPPFLDGGASGTGGILATVEFKVTNYGVCDLDLKDTELSTVINGTIEPIGHYLEDGVFDNRPEKMLPPYAIFTAPTLGAEGESLTFNASASHDEDDGGWIVSYKWDFGDGTNVTGKIVDHAFTTVGIYTVKLTVTDNDSLTDSAEDYVTVLAHDIAIISVVVSPTTVKAGESVSIRVSVANEGNFTETFNVTAYYTDKPIETKTGITLTSGDSATLTFDWNTVDVAAGDYTVKAVASRSENEKDYEDNTRFGDAITIEEQISQITISVNPSTITVGEDTIINGTITPTRIGVTVTIQQRPAEGDWSILETVTTDSNGRYSYIWSPGTAGTYEVKASWEGDPAHLGDESNVDSLMVQEAPAPNIYLYAVAGVLIFIVAATGLYFLRARKRTRVQT